MAVFQLDGGNSQAIRIFQTAATRSLFTGMLNYQLKGCRVISTRPSRLVESFRQTAELAAERFEKKKGTNFPFSSQQCAQMLQEAGRAEQVKSVRRALNEKSTFPQRKAKNEKIHKDSIALQKMPRKSAVNTRKMEKWMSPRPAKRSKKNLTTKIFPTKVSFILKCSKGAKGSCSDQENAWAGVFRNRVSNRTNTRVRTSMEGAGPLSLHNTLRSRSDDPNQMFHCLAMNSQADITPKVFFSDLDPKPCDCNAYPCDHCP